MLLVCAPEMGLCLKSTVVHRLAPVPVWTECKCEAWNFTLAGTNRTSLSFHGPVQTFSGFSSCCRKQMSLDLWLNSEKMTSCVFSNYISLTSVEGK